MEVKHVISKVINILFLEKIQIECKYVLLSYVAWTEEIGHCNETQCIYSLGKLSKIILALQKRRLLSPGQSLLP